MYKKYGLYINGRWQPSSSGDCQEVIDPATEAVLGTIPTATAEDLDAALTAAQQGLAIWRGTNPWERSAKIRRTSELIR